MILSKLQKTTQKSKKKLGRGYGSQKGGHTSGRGQKGQKSRSKVPMWFEGGQLPQIRRFPFIRGKGRFKSLKRSQIELNLSQLNQFKSKATVDLKSLTAIGLLTDKDLRQNTVKILGSGSIDKALTIKVPTSKRAQQKIEAAGGQVNRE